MKKMTMSLCVLFFLIGCVIAVNSQTNQTTLNSENARHIPVQPTISFPFPPVQVSETNYYDYLIGGNNGNSIQIQPSAQGLFLNYMIKSPQTSNRKVKYVYINRLTHELVSTGQLTNGLSSEGFVTLAIDPVSQNPFFSWHAQYSAEDNGGIADEKLNVYFTTGEYSDISLPEFPFLFPKQRIFENTSDEFCFIWPSVFIGQSPIPNKRRLFVFAHNSGTRPYGNPSSNVKMAWADFSSELFENQNLNLSWNYRTFEYLDAIHYTPSLARAYPTYAVKDNKVIIGGFVSAEKGISAQYDTTNILYPPHDLFYLVNESFGEGDFTLYTFNTSQPVESPILENGAYDPYYHAVEIRGSGTAHQNLTFDNLNRIHLNGIYQTTYLGNENDPESDRINIPYSNTVKDVVFNLSNHLLNIKDIDPMSSYPNDNQLFPIWDLTDDSLPDSYDENGQWENQFYNIPFCFYDPDDFFIYSFFRETQANTAGWKAVLWGNSTKTYQYRVLNDTSFVEYNTCPEYCLSVSNNNGSSWTDPIYLNPYNTPEFADMILSFAYVAPEIEVLNETTGRLHLMFLDDYDYGVYGQGGMNYGSRVLYGAIDVDFSYVSNQDPVSPTATLQLFQNYPNPFNPVTTIKFNLKNNDKINLSIYNIKGQLVKTLINENLSSGTHEVIWNGKNSLNQDVSSGVYFYKLNSSHTSELKKMILIK